MVNNNEVINFIRKKLNTIKKDSFLKEIEKHPIYFQIFLIDNRINEIMNYIIAAKNGNKSYDNNVNSLRKDILVYQLYLDCIDILDNYNNKEQRIANKIGKYSVENSLNKKQIEILDSKDYNNLSCHDLTMIAKHLIEKNSIDELIVVTDLIFKKYNKKELTEEEYIYLCGLSLAIKYKKQMTNHKSEVTNSIKDIKSMIDRIASSYNKKKINYNDEYTVIESLIEDEELFNKTLVKNPNIVNVRDSNGNLLSYNIMVKYLDTYFLEFQGIKNDVPKEYYLNIYNKIVSSPNCIYQKEDLEEFSSLYKYFIKASSIVLKDNTTAIKTLDNISKKRN